MTFEQTSAAARSAVRPPAASTSTPTRPFYRRGMLLTVGAVAWGVDTLITDAVDVIAPR